MLDDVDLNDCYVRVREEDGRLLRRLAKSIGVRRAGLGVTLKKR